MIQNLEQVIDFISHGVIGSSFSLGPGVLWIRNIDPNGNKTELTEQDIIFLATTIKSNPVINRLYLDDCILLDLNGSLATLIRTCNLSGLKFKGLDLNASVLSEIAEGVAQNSSLNNIAFCNVSFGTDDGAEILSNGLRTNSSLGSMSFNQTNLTQTAIRILIQTAIMHRDAQWSEFKINANNPRLNVENRALLALMTSTGHEPHKIRPILINWHSRALIKRLTEVKTYYESLLYLDRIKLINQLYTASLRPPAQIGAVDEAEFRPMIHKSFKHTFLNMFRRQLTEHMGPAKNMLAFLPTEVTSKIMSFMPRHQTLLAPKEILRRVKTGYCPRYES